MSAFTPRLRMFAGPNGSGKTTVKNNLEKAQEWFGVYINPDEIEKTIGTTGFLDLRAYGVAATVEEMDSFFSSSPLLTARCP